MQVNDLLFDYQPQRKPKTERYLHFKWCYDYTSEEQINKLENMLKANNIAYVLYKSANFYPHEWIISKGRFTWYEIMKMVNSVQSAKYDYISSNNERMFYSDEDQKYKMMVYC